MAEGTIADLTGNIPISLWEDNHVNYHSRSLQDNKHSCSLLEWCKEVNYKSKFRHLCHSRWEAQKHNYGRAFRSSTKGWIDSSNSLHKNCREGSAIPSLHTLFQKAFANHSQFASDRNVIDANTLWFFPTAIKEFFVHFSVQGQDESDVIVTAFEQTLKTVVPRVGEMLEEQLTEQLLLLNNITIRYSSLTHIVSAVEL